MLASLAILGLLVTAGFGRFGSETLENIRGESYVRRLALDLNQARRRTIATGDNHYLALTLASGKVASYALTRRVSGGDVVVDEPQTTPTGVDVVASHAELEYDFDGSTLAGHTVTVVGPTRSWLLGTIAATGAIEVTDTTP